MATSYGRLLDHDPSIHVEEMSNVSTSDIARTLIARLSRDELHDSYLSEQGFLAALMALRDLLALKTDVGSNRFSVAVLRRFFDQVRLSVDGTTQIFNGGTHLEIGCGPVNPFARMFTHIMAGAQKGICLELEPIRDLPRALRFLAEIAGVALTNPRRIFGEYSITAREILENLEGFDLAKLELGDPEGVDSRRLVFVQRPIEDTGLDSKSIDLVVSNSVLEHVSDLENAFTEIRRISREGSFSVHGVDAIDHRSYADPSIHPLEFLCLDSADPIVHGSNRVRLFQMEELMARHGWTIRRRLNTQHATIPSEIRARLAAPWRSMNDAQISESWTVLVGQRPD